MNSAIVGVAIGLAFIFAVLAAAASAVTEAVARFLGLRGEYLLRGLRTLVDDKHNDFKTRFRVPANRRPAAVSAPTEEGDQLLRAIVSHPLVQAHGDKGHIDRDAGNTALSPRERRQLPSYLSARTFAAAVIDMLVPNASGKTSLDAISHAVQGWPESRLQQALAALIAQAEGDVSRFRASLESWYDDHMARVTGWYKRHVRWISLGAAAVFVLVFNLSAVRISSALYVDGPLRATVVSQARKLPPCHHAKSTNCLSKALNEVAALENAGLPVGWSTSAKCTRKVACNWTDRYDITEPGRDPWHNFLHVLLDLLGYLVMIAATLPGARFWFDALGRLNVFRSSGPKPSQTSSTGLYVVPMPVAPAPTGSSDTEDTSEGRR